MVYLTRYVKDNDLEGFLACLAQVPAENWIAPHQAMINALSQKSIPMVTALLTARPGLQRTVIRKLIEANDEKLLTYFMPSPLTSDWAYEVVKVAIELDRPEWAVRMIEGNVLTPEHLGVSLNKATQLGQLDMVRLLNASLPIEMATQRIRTTALGTAAMNGHLPIIEVLLEGLYRPLTHGIALRKAAAVPYPEVVKKLLSVTTSNLESIVDSIYQNSLKISADRRQADYYAAMDHLASHGTVDQQASMVSRHGECMPETLARVRQGALIKEVTAQNLTERGPLSSDRRRARP